MSKPIYAWSAEHTYNVFGANEHYEVTLWRLNKKGTKYKEVNSWAYSTFLLPSVAYARAEKRIEKLRRIYNAVPI